MKYAINLTVEELNLIVKYIGQGPWTEVNNLIVNLTDQMRSHQKEKEKKNEPPQQSPEAKGTKSDS